MENLAFDVNIPTRLNKRWCYAVRWPVCVYCSGLKAALVNVFHFCWWSFRSFNAASIDLVATVNAASWSVYCYKVQPQLRTCRLIRQSISRFISPWAVHFLCISRVNSFTKIRLVAVNRLNEGNVPSSFILERRLNRLLALRLEHWMFVRACCRLRWMRFWSFNCSSHLSGGSPFRKHQ